MGGIHDRRRLGAIFMASAVLAASGQATAQPVQAPQSNMDTVVSDVTVTGKKMPGADAPKSATCEYLVANDPAFREQLRIASSLGSSLMGPRVYLPTRPPLTPDFSAPPLTPPGSALPDIFARRQVSLIDQTVIQETSATDFNLQLAEDSETVINAQAVDEVSAARLSCRQLYTAGSGSTFVSSGDTVGSAPGMLPPQFDASRARIAQRDKTLPMAFALFEDGRYIEALEWFKKAHNKLPDVDGGDEAALMIGRIYLQAFGDRPNMSEAIKWLDKAAGAKFDVNAAIPAFDPKKPENNTAIGEAAVILGNIYLKGFGVPKNGELARKWFSRAYAVGHIPAAKTLGDMYYYGYETPRDVRKALSYYKKAAAFNLVTAQYALGEIYYHGADGVPPNMKFALDRYDAAAKLDHPGALYALAMAYDTGEGVAADPEKALVFYKAAALNGNLNAQVALGTYFYEGTQIAKDDLMARKWFEAAAVQGQSDGMFNLAAMMVKGEGGEKDLVKAWVWFSLAQAAGNQKAPTALAAIEPQMAAADKQAASGILKPKT